MQSAALVVLQIKVSMTISYVGILCQNRKGYQEKGLFTWIRQGSFIGFSQELNDNSSKL